MLVLGLDPGKSGGIAWQRVGDRTSASGVKFPATESDLAALLRSLMEQDAEWFAYIEKVGATPQMGTVSAFTFGRGYGFLRGVLVGLGVPFDEVTPMRWQSVYGLRSSKKLGQGDTDKHNAIKGKAQQLFPSLKITHANAAALLIADWGCRQFQYAKEIAFAP